jgi:hypothetical protein
MTLTIFVQAFLAPLFAAFIAAFAKRYYALILAIAFWAISFWVKGTTVQAMDSVAMAFTMSSILLTAYSFNPESKKRVFATVQFVGLVALSVWQVKNFASDIPIIGWVVQLTVLAFFVGLSWRQEWPATIASRTFAKRFNVVGLLWLVPSGFVAMVSPIAGSLLVGQLAGLIAFLGLCVWLYQGLNRSSTNELALLVATPSVFIGQMAWHYVEIPWTSLLLGLVPLLLLFWRGLTKQALLIQLLTCGLAFASALALGLYLEWPEQSLY